jgi:hypothetical protein
LPESWSNSPKIMIISLTFSAQILNCIMNFVVYCCFNDGFKRLIWSVRLGKLIFVLTTFCSCFCSAFFCSNSFLFYRNGYLYKNMTNAFSRTKQCSSPLYTAALLWFPKNLIPWWDSNPGLRFLRRMRCPQRRAAIAVLTYLHHVYIFWTFFVATFSQIKSQKSESQIGSVGHQGCQMVFFKLKIQILLYFWRLLNGVFWYIYDHLVFYVRPWPFGIVCGQFGLFFPVLF